MRIEWSTGSKAFLKSINTPKQCSPPSHTLHHVKESHEGEVTDSIKNSWRITKHYFIDEVYYMKCLYF